MIIAIKSLALVLALSTQALSVCATTLISLQPTSTPEMVKKNWTANRSESRRHAVLPCALSPKWTMHAPLHVEAVVKMIQHICSASRRATNWRIAIGSQRTRRRRRKGSTNTVPETTPRGNCTLGATALWEMLAPWHVVFVKIPSLSHLHQLLPPQHQLCLVLLPISPLGLLLRNLLLSQPWSLPLHPVTLQVWYQVPRQVTHPRKPHLAHHLTSHLRYHLTHQVWYQVPRQVIFQVLTPLRVSSLLQLLPLHQLVLTMQHLRSIWKQTIIL